VTTYDLYGSRTLTAGDLCARLGVALGLAFDERESSYRGAYHRAGGIGREEFEVQPNDVPGDDGGREPMEERFADVPLLLYVNATERGDEVRHLLSDVPGLVFLHRDTVPDG
jgi:hypothetical protein